MMTSGSTARDIQHRKRRADDDYVPKDRACQ